MLFVWIALYGLVNILPDFMDGTYWFRGIWMAVYDSLFFLWIFAKEKQNIAGLNPMRCPMSGGAVHLLLLGIFPLYNCVTTQEVSFLGAGFLLQMVCVALTEEVFFRGFLLSWLRRLGTIPGILLTSLAFAVLHVLNFTENADSLYVLLQILSSFFVSVCFCAVTMEFGSILPCVVAHFLTNITGTGSFVGKWAIPGLLGCITVYALWGWKLILRDRFSVDKGKRSNEKCHC